MFPLEHPRLMSDDELCNWVKSLLKRQAPESRFLDYKAKISTESQRDKIELCKDVSSFANEGGGVLLYGVPEEKESGTPIPKNLSECGIEIPTGLTEQIENILLDIIVPPLPELEIRILKLEELSPKSLLMIYHPESWNKPHMVEKCGHARYYHRECFSAKPMNERQVEAAYLSRKASLDYAENFFKTGDFRAIPKVGRFFRAVICPRFTLIRKEKMREEQFRSWLDNNPPGGRRGDWVPFLDGWCFRGYPQGKFHGKQYELRLFHNGAVCFNMDLDSAIYEKELNLDYMENTVFRNMILLNASKAFEFLRISGPLSIQVNLYNVKGINAFFHSGEWFSNRRTGPTPIETDSISFIEEMSVNELRFHLDNVLKRLIDRLASAFGIWRG
jgi:hypothetical protein